MLSEQMKSLANDILNRSQQLLGDGLILKIKETKKGKGQNNNRYFKN